MPHGRVSKMCLKVEVEVYGQTHRDGLHQGLTGTPVEEIIKTLGHSYTSSLKNASILATAPSDKPLDLTRLR